MLTHFQPIITKNHFLIILKYHCGTISGLTFAKLNLFHSVFLVWKHKSVDPHNALIVTRSTKFSSRNTGRNGAHHLTNHITEMELK